MATYIHTLPAVCLWLSAQRTLPPQAKETPITGPCWVWVAPAADLMREQVTMNGSRSARRERMWRRGCLVCALRVDRFTLVGQVISVLSLQVVSAI